MKTFLPIAAIVAAIISLTSCTCCRGSTRCNPWTDKDCYYQDYYHSK